MGALKKDRTPDINRILAQPAHKACSMRGADMGRRNVWLGSGPEKLLLQRVRPVDYDYDAGGAYWGFGKDSLPLWCAFSPSDTKNEVPVMIFVRARDRAAAKIACLSILGNAGWSFFR